jgi:hypothetical protein
MCNALPKPHSCAAEVRERAALKMEIGRVSGEKKKMGKEEE